MRGGTAARRDGQLSVLYVDDDEALLELTSDFLEAQADDITVAVESSARDALERLRTESFDAVVSDYQMPGLDGLAFLQVLREDRGDDVPFIVFTGEGREEVAMDAVNLGADRYLQKGGDPTAQYGVLEQAIRQEVRHHRTELELRKREEDLRITLDSIGDGVIATDREGRVARVNQVAEALTGWDRDEAVGRALDDVFDIRDRETGEPVENPVETVLREGRTVGLANGTLLVARDGTERHIADSAAPISDDGAVRGVVLVFRDVSDGYLEERREQAQADALLDLSTDEDLVAGRFEEAKRTITETVARTLDVERVSVWWLDDDILRCVDLYELGADRHSSGQELRADGYPRYFDALESSLVVAAEDAQSDPRTSELEEGYLDRLGIVSMLDATIRSAGEVVGVVCNEHVGDPREWEDDERRFAAEVSDLVLRAANNRDRRVREGELEQRNRTLEDLVDVLSHDLQSPLMAARGSIELARETGDDRHLDRATQALSGLEEIVDGTVTLAESGWSADDAAPVSLAEASGAAWGRLDETGGTLELTPAAEAAEVVANPDGLQPLLQNLFENAVRHAGGPVTVRVDCFEGGFSVADDGPGIPERDRESVFDYGYTTHPEGTGLGLAIVDRIAGAHGWSVAAEESDRGGAEFVFDGVDADRSR